ncbi:MAG: hypothetical protein WAV74_23065, partial [Anaerolineae bacterium]
THTDCVWMEMMFTDTTRGSACTSYVTLGNMGADGLPKGNWIQEAGLAIDWPGLRTYLGEQ